MMMKKLLHERLRESISEPLGCSVMNFSICDSYAPFIQLTKNDAQALADEIERYYSPLPRDNKGMPYHVGETVYSVDPETEYSAEIIDINATGIVRIRWEDGSTDYVDPADIQHECPQPKVLDADGVEIKVGDTVWKNGVSQYKAYVETIHDDGTITVRFFDGMVGNHRLPDDYTHKEPDSLEKLRDDMKEHALTFWSIGETYPRKKADEFVDRLSALIERGA